MEILLRVAIGAGGAALGGAAAGLIAAILTLWARGLRNARLQARGLPGYKDCVLPLPYVVLSTLGSFILGAGLAIFLSPWRSAVIGACVPAGLLLFLSVIGTIVQASAD